MKSPGPDVNPKIWQIILIAVIAITFTAIWLKTYESLNSVIWMNEFVNIQPLDNPCRGYPLLPARWSMPEILTCPGCDPWRVYRFDEGRRCTFRL